MGVECGRGKGVEEVQWRLLCLKETLTRKGRGLWYTGKDVQARRRAKGMYKHSRSLGLGQHSNGGWTR